MVSLQTFMLTRHLMYALSVPSTSCAQPGLTQGHALEFACCDMEFLFQGQQSLCIVLIRYFRSLCKLNEEEEKMKVKEKRKVKDRIPCEILISGH